MRGTWVLLAPLLLAGCVKDSASHYINGNEHTLSVRVAQDYFWKKTVGVTVVAARWPDCQRQFNLGELPLAEIVYDFYDLLKSRDQLAMTDIPMEMSRYSIRRTKGR